MFVQAKNQLLDSYFQILHNVDVSQLEQHLKRFQADYGPHVLAGLNGRELMDFWHGTKSGEGLLYWLEYPVETQDFGSIAGGSALKFKVYRGSDGDWKTKGPGNYPVSCSEAEAVHITETLAKDLLQGCKAVERYNLQSGHPEAWREFIGEVESMAPPVQREGFNNLTLNLNWAHKYLSIIYPGVFSFHHLYRHLSSHLARLGIQPQDTRYGNDFQWLELRLSDPELESCHPVLLMHAAYSKERGFGYDTGYWRVGTDEGDLQHQITTWPMMRDEGCISIGWNALGDLNLQLKGLTGEAAINRVKELLKAEFPDKNAIAIGKSARQIRDFYEVMQPGDRVAAMKGQQLMGVGEITGDYAYERGGLQYHRRLAQWHWIAPAAREGSGRAGLTWKDSPGFLTTVNNFSKKWPHVLYVEKLFLSVEPIIPTRPDVPQHSGLAEPSPPKSEDKPSHLMPLDPRTAHVKQVLERKGQVILFGPPGTGKTYHARHAAQEILSRELCQGASWANLDATQKQAVEERITFCTFHPAYSYEEFIEGFRPTVTPQGPTFQLRDGLFLELCASASKAKGPFVLIIDEINRANVAAVLGELLSLLEKDKRGSLVLTLPLSRRAFTVPDNLWIIGTMNTADRSISLLDAALRRRFGFIELLPEPERLDAVIEGLHLGSLLSEVNARVRQHVPRNARELQVGHAYFLDEGKPLTSRSALHMVMRDDVLPLLAEYCYEDYSALAAIVGEAIVDAEAQRVRPEVQASDRLMLVALQQIVAEIPLPASLEVAGNGGFEEGTEEDETDGDDQSTVDAATL